MSSGTFLSVSDSWEFKSTKQVPSIKLSIQPIIDEKENIKKPCNFEELLIEIREGNAKRRLLKGKTYLSYIIFVSFESLKLTCEKNLKFSKKVLCKLS